MGRSRSRKVQPAEIARLVLAHLHDPSTVASDLYEDMRHADQGSWETDGHTVTKNGDPLPADGGLGDGHDGRALDFDGSGDELEADQTPWDIAADEDVSVGFLGKGDDTRAGLISTRFGGSGIQLDYFNQTVPRMVVEDNSGTAENDATNSVTANSDLHLLVGSLDRGGTRIMTSVDGSQTSTGYTSLGAADASRTLRIGSQGGSRLLTGTCQLAFVHPQWISEKQSALLYDLLMGNAAPGTLRRLKSWIYGSRETGYKRALPSYLTDAFGSSGPRFWWSADRHITHLDGEAVAQLSDFAGAKFGVQRTTTNKPIARGPSTRGKPLDHLEFGGDDKIVSQDFVDDPTNLTFFGRFDLDSLGQFHGIIGHRDSSGAPHIFVRYRANQNRFEIQARDSDNNTALATIPDTDLDPSDGPVFFVTTFDKSGGRVYLTARSANDGPHTASDTATYTGNFSADQRRIGEIGGGVNEMVGNQSIIGYDPTTLSDADADTLRDKMFEATS